MKHANIIKSIFAAIALLAASGAWADTETVGDYTWTYRINGDTAEIYNDGSCAISPSPTGAVTIPSSLGGKPVTSIGYYAFQDCSGLTSVTIPDCVTNIGGSAFNSTPFYNNQPDGLIVFSYVRGRFNNDAPGVYQRAHVSRKTYSSIVSNELRPVSKQTAIMFALALHLSTKEAEDLLKAAGFAFSSFILEDIIIKSCFGSEIYDWERVNEILLAHHTKPLLNQG